jgi:hypothetical protein
MAKRKKKGEVETPPSMETPVTASEIESKKRDPIALKPVVGMGQSIDCTCQNPECGFSGQAWINRGWWLGHIATCPYCGGEMHAGGEQMNITINARGSGAHSGTIGDRKKRMMVERSEKLRKKQWDNHEPVKVAEGRKIRNPTPGGPYDPNGPFQPKKREKTIFTPKGSSSGEGKG